MSYVLIVHNLALIDYWLPAQGDLVEAAAKPAAAVRTKAAPAQAGAHYFELACDGLPWVGCERCAAAAGGRGWPVKSKLIACDIGPDE